MKSLLTLFLCTLCSMTYAQNFQTKLDIFNSDFDNHELTGPELDQEYSIKFSVVSITPLCPAGKPGDLVCMAKGKVIKVKATLNGCVDKLAFFHSNTYMYDNKLHVEIDSMGYANPDSARIRCVKMPVVYKTVVTQFEDFEEVVIENLNTLQ